MTHGYGVVLLAIGHAEMAIAQDLAARYCPHSKTVFLFRAFAIFGVLLASALALFFVANRGPQAPGRARLYIVAGALLLFAIGSGAFVLYGLSGCSGAAAEGLIWDWP